MIGYLRGKILSIGGEKVILLTGTGVGYTVNTKPAELVEGEELELFIYTAVRENEVSLWGFKAREELELFELLLSVSGVGLKTAMALVQHVGVTKVKLAIGTGDITGLKTPGIGQKIAERVILELRGKIGGSPGDSDVSESPGEARGQVESMLEDAIAGLESLGYKRSEAEVAARRLKLSTYKDTQSLLKAILVKL
jgi:Holliday junction DNA helicase RuvA